MKSQRFSIPKLPFGKSKRAIQQPVDEKKLVDEQQSVDEEAPVDEKKSGAGDAFEQSREESLASVIQEEVYSDGEDSELHVYETRLDTRGEEVCLRAGTKTKFTPPKRKSHRACLVLNRYFDQDGKVYSTQLEIQSQHIIKALRKVIGTYQGVGFTGKVITIDGAPECLFHFQDELRQHAEASDNDQLKSHMQLCLEYMEKTLHREIKISKSFMSNASVSPELEYRYLWMVFKPGCLVYEKKNEIERLSRLRDVVAEGDRWSLSTERINYSRCDIGLEHHNIIIDRHDGCKPLCELTAFPLHFHPDQERIRNVLLERGRKFLAHCGIHHRFYDGAALMCGSVSDSAQKTSLCSVRHRIMLDLEQYSRSVADTSSDLIFGTRVYHSGTEAISNLSDEEIMTCNYRLPGYSLELKRWGLFSVAHITEVAYNDKAFHGLLLPETQKTLISCLLERQDHQQDDGFDDLIQGKGKGLIFLLHGPPGVGKTYTAESIADHTSRPLLKVNSGELNRPGFLVENRLAEIFLLATRWSCITLLDEADVFMQQRSLETLEMNGLVSILLRVLEYYEGILFLTTNRVGTIDQAFKSRIHLPIAYPSLSANFRRELWNTSILRANRGQKPEWLTTEFLDHLMEKQVNGREIKNIVRLGYSLARKEKRDMKTVDLLQGLDSLEKFEADLSSWSEQRKIENARTLQDRG